MCKCMSLQLVHLWCRVHGTAPGRSREAVHAGATPRHPTDLTAGRPTRFLFAWAAIFGSPCTLSLAHRTYNEWALAFIQNTTATAKMRMECITFTEIKIQKTCRPCYMQGLSFQVRYLRWREETEKTKDSNSMKTCKLKKRPLRGLWKTAEKTSTACVYRKLWFNVDTPD